jgi:hypothetical protein
MDQLNPQAQAAGQGSRGWWRKYFEDHPGLAAKRAEAYAGDKHRVACRPCLQERVQMERRADELAVARQERPHQRTDQVILDMCMSSLQF